MRSLIIYYSRTGKTKFLAEKLGEELESDRVGIKDLKKRGGVFGFLRAVLEARLGRKTEVVPNTINLTEYGIIILATPVWAYSPTPAINTFLGACSLAGKKVILLVTSRGVGYRRALDILKKRVEERGGEVVGVGSVKTWFRGEKHLSRAGAELAKLWKGEIESLGSDTYGSLG